MDGAVELRLALPRNGEIRIGVFWVFVAVLEMCAGSAWLVFFSSLVEVSARVPHMACLARVALE